MKISSFKSCLLMFYVMFYFNITAQIINTDSDGNVLKDISVSKYTYQNHSLSVSSFSYANVRALTEINTTSNAEAYPWISGDGLRLYYTSGSTNNQLMFTQRTSTASPFGTPTIVSVSTSSLYSCWFSNDELDAYICTVSSLYHVHRNSISSAFGTPQLITITGAPAYTSIKGASLNSSQTVLFLQLYGTNNIIAEFSKTGTNTFSYVRTVSLPSGYEPRVGQLSKDELSFFVGAKSGNADPLLCQLTRTATTVAFDVNTFQQIQGINDINYSNQHPTMSNNLNWVAFVRNDTNLWTANEIYIAQRIIPTSTCSPSQPGTISGNSTVNSSTSQTYSVAPVSGATSYIWTLPSGWTGSSTTNIISVTTGSVGGTISVAAQNSCGVSPQTNLLVTITAGGGGTTNCATPQIVKDIFQGSLSAFSTYPFPFCNSNGYFYFEATESYTTTGSEIWKSDGTQAGTVLLKDIATGTLTSYPRYLTDVNGTLFFRACTDNNNYTYELWKSDGSSAGTVMVKDIVPGVNGSDPHELISFKDKLYFVADDEINGPELWMSDGTLAGTVMVKDIYPGSSGSDPKYLTVYNDNLYFQANAGYSGGNIGPTLWKSDGTTAGTVPVKNTGGPSYPENLTVSNNQLFFSASSTLGRELWKSDGTVAGTMMVKDINPNTSGSSMPRKLTDVNGTLFFWATDGVNGFELWKSDGTIGGTILVKDINPGSANSEVTYNPDDFTCANLGNILFFRANNGTNGEELWKSDGTSAGTVMVKDINPGSGESGIYSMIGFNGKLYFQAKASNNEYAELWSSDGTSSGTTMVMDICQGSSCGSLPYAFHVYNSNLYFSASNSSQGRELWQLCGSTIGIKEITLSNDQEIIYPNPTTGIFKIKTEKQTTDAQLKINNVHGQLIFESKEFVKEINLSDHPKGIYFLQIKTNEGTVTKKVILQ